MPETVNELNTTKEECIEKFRNATFGEEVRGALIDLANLVYTDVINAALSGLKKGDSITNVSIQNGDLILEITSYDIDSDTSTVTTKNLGNIKGPTGQDGPTGPMGPQGNSITAVSVDSDGNLYITIGSGSPALIGNVKGPKGDTGATGPKGDPGDVGPEHEWSIDGSLSPTSTNPVQNRAIYNELQGKQDKLSPSNSDKITKVGSTGEIEASNYEFSSDPLSPSGNQIVATDSKVAAYTYSKTESDNKYLTSQDIANKQDKLSSSDAGKLTNVGMRGQIKASGYTVNSSQALDPTSYTKIPTEAGIGNYTYSKTESDNRFARPSAFNNYYNKSESDNKYLTKTEASTNHYTKTESDSTFVKKIDIDDELDDESTNPVQNQAIAGKIAQIEHDYSAPDPTIDINSTKPVQNHAVAEALLDKLDIGDFNSTIFDDIDMVFSNSNGGFYYNGDCPAAPALFIEAYEYDSQYTYFLSYVDSLDNEQWHRIANITLLVQNIMPIDSALDSVSENPVQNKIVTEALNKKYEYKVISNSINTISGLNGYTDEDKIYIVDCNFQPINGKARIIFVKSNDPQPGIDLYPNSAQFIFTESGDIFVRTTDITGAFDSLQLFNRNLQVDSVLSTTSENPVQNKVVKAAIDAIEQAGVTVDAYMSNSSENPVQNKVISYELNQKQSTSDKDDALSSTTSDTYDRAHYPSIKCLKTVQNAIPTVPTNVSEFTNDAGYLTQHQSLSNYYTKSEVDSDLNGYQTKIDSSNKLSSDFVDDTNQTNKFVTGTDKINWNNKLSSADGAVKSSNIDNGAVTLAKLHSEVIDEVNAYSKQGFNLFNKDNLIYGKCYAKSSGELTDKAGTACLMIPVDSVNHLRVRCNKRFYRVNLFDSNGAHIGSGTDGRYAADISGAAYVGLSLNVSGADMGAVPSCNPGEVMAAYTQETAGASSDKWNELFGDLPDYVPFGVYIDKNLYSEVSDTEDSVDGLLTSVGDLQTSVGSLQTSVGSLQTSVGSLQTSVTSLDGFRESVSDRITPGEVISALSEISGITVSGDSAVISGTSGTKTWAALSAKAYPGKAYVLEFYGKTSDDSFQGGTGQASLLLVEFLDSNANVIGAGKEGGNGKYNGYVMGTTNMGYHRYGFVSPWGAQRMQLRVVTRGANSMTVRGVKLTPVECYPQRQRKGVLLDGHLGAVLIAPRNTMPSFELGKIAGYSTMITNIKATGDGVLVALHNQTIDATSNGAGDVTDYTYSQLLNYDFGSWFNAAYAGTKIPKFETVVKFLANGGIRLGVSVHGTLSDQNLADMCAIIVKYDMQDCLIKSFDMNFINKVHAILGSDAEYMFCAGSALPTKADVDSLAALNARTTLEFNCNYTEGAEQIIAYCLENGVNTSAYTVNNVQLMKSLINKGITRFTTDMFSDIVFPMD